MALVKVLSGAFFKHKIRIVAEENLNALIMQCFISNYLLSAIVDIDVCIHACKTSFVRSSSFFCIAAMRKRKKMRELFLIFNFHVCFTAVQIREKYNFIKLLRHC
jgi:hypothetical protein